MLLFIPRSLCALKRVAAKEQHPRFAATQGIRIALASGIYRAEATDGRRAMVVQGLIPGEDPPWPGFKDLPDDAGETIILPRDLERACKVGEDFLQSRFGLFGIATMGNDVCLGLGSELVTCRTVEGRFPNINAIIPKKRPLFTFSFDPRPWPRRCWPWRTCYPRRTGACSSSTSATISPSVSVPGTSTTATWAFGISMSPMLRNALPSGTSGCAIWRRTWAS
jgi:hypothetical protein